MTAACASLRYPALWCAIVCSVEVVMSNGQQWHQIAAGDLLTFSSPVALTPASERGIDSDVGGWRGEGLQIQKDSGPFADPLTRYAKGPSSRSAEETIDGQPARVVAFDQADGSRFTAVHFPNLPDAGADARKLTFVVISRGDRTADEALRIVRSIRFRR
jgi:hypothetical protein